MIKFILKGILRDRNRSLLPIIVITIGVFMTVFLSAWMQGIFSDMIDLNAKYTTGHVKIMTQSYAENESQMPNDLALLDVENLMTNLRQDFPDITWVKRIQFGGLIDIPDKNGETRAQGPAIGKAIDFFSGNSQEIERLNIKQSIKKGEIPKHSGQALISDEFAEKFGLKIGDEITLFGSTMNGSMMFKTFIISGTISFGISILDRGAIIIDITDAQEALDMQDATSEILGYFNDAIYDTERAEKTKQIFNSKYTIETDEFSPKMYKLEDQNGLEQLLATSKNMSSIMVFIFILAMSIVLWNTGLLGGLRRYNEYGIRLALGEANSHIFKTIIYEAIIVGIIGSTIGTILALILSLYLQNNGIDFSSFLKNVDMMLPQIYRCKITPDLFYIGFIPGLFAMTIGSALAGLSIYKRRTADLFNELI